MKKLLALLLALCLLLPAGLAAAETVFPLSEEKITFRIATWQRSGQVDYNDMLMWQKYEEMSQRAYRLDSPARQHLCGAPQRHVHPG